MFGRELTDAQLGQGVHCDHNVTLPHRLNKSTCVADCCFKTGSYISYPTSASGTWNNVVLLRPIRHEAGGCVVPLHIRVYAMQTHCIILCFMSASGITNLSSSKLDAQIKCRTTIRTWRGTIIEIFKWTWLCMRIDCIHALETWNA